jgi:hypothetical protein
MKEMETLEKKIKELNNIWVKYFFSYPYFHGRVKFTEEEKTNYVGVIFGYFGDSFDVVFSTPPVEFDSYVSKFSYQIALLQSIYVQQDLTEELLRIFKTGVERSSLNSDPNYKVNRNIRNELIGHPISRNKDFSLRSSTVFGYEKSGNTINYLKYDFPVEKDVLKTIELNDVLSRHEDFLNNYLDKLLDQSYLLLKSFKKDSLDVLGHLLNNHITKQIINFCVTHFKEEFNHNNEIKLADLMGIKNNNSHPRYEYSFKLYLDYIHQFHLDTTQSVDKILNKEYLKLRAISTDSNTTLIPKIIFADKNLNISDSNTFERTNYNYEMSKLYSKRNYMDFSHFSISILSENKDDSIIITELEHLKDNLNNYVEFICSWNYLNNLLTIKLNSQSKLTPKH